MGNVLKIYINFKSLKFCGFIYFFDFFCILKFWIKKVLYIYVYLFIKALKMLFFKKKKVKSSFGIIFTLLFFVL